MRIVFLFVFFSFLFVSFHLEAQRKCATTLYEDRLHQHDREEYRLRFEKWMSDQLEKQKIQTQSFGSALRTQETVTIPVVVHIVHNGELIGDGVNISIDQVESQIEVLNEDFQRLNPDTVNTPEIFKPLASNLDVEFVLARRDPEGNPTNGVLRVQGPKTSYNFNTDNELLKSQSYWPAEDYLNIWVCNLSGGFIGYAQYPPINLPGLEDEDTENRLTDGVVVDYFFFGSNRGGGNFDLNEDYDQGRTTTHEVGHYFGLRHIWGDPAFNENGCNVDDFVEDTPNAEEPHFGCPPDVFHGCSGVTMFQNYMDYTDDACMNLFTTGQADRMQIVLDNSPRRNSLKNSLGAIPPDIDIYDISLEAILKPANVSMNNTPAPIIRVLNNGNETIGTFDIQLGINGDAVAIITYGGDSIFTGQTIDIEISGLGQFAEGSYNLEVNLVSTELPDFNEDNNSGSKFFIVDRTEEIVPYRETFEDLSPDLSPWVVYNPDQILGWRLNDVNDGLAVEMPMFAYDQLGEEDWLVSPVFDFSGLMSASMRFDFSYAQRPGFVDKLLVLGSVNGGEDFDYDLLELNSDEMKVTESSDPWQPEDDSDWMQRTIDLSALAGRDSVRIAFVTVNGNSNNLFIDDVEFFLTSPDQIVIPDLNNVLVYPNPTINNQTNVAIYSDQRTDIEMVLYSSTGKILRRNNFQNALNQSYTFDFTDLQAGMYFVKVASPGFSVVRRIIHQP
jgi:hypothetical protein